MKSTLEIKDGVLSYETDKFLIIIEEKSIGVEFDGDETLFIDYICVITNKITNERINRNIPIAAIFSLLERYINAIDLGKFPK